MQQLWEIVGSLVGVGTLTALVLVGIVVVRTYVPQKWGQQCASILRDDVVARGWTSGLLPITHTRAQRLSEHLRPLKDDDTEQQKEDDHKVRLAALILLRGELQSAQVVRRIEGKSHSLSLAAYERLATRAGNTESLDRLLLLWPWWVRLEGLRLRWAGATDSLPPVAARSGNRAAQIFGYAGVTGTIFAVVIWGAFNEVLQLRTGWVAYVGGWAAVAMVGGLSVFLGLEIRNQFRIIRVGRKPLRRRDKWLLLCSSLFLLTVQVTVPQGWFTAISLHFNDWASSLVSRVPAPAQHAIGLGIMVIATGWLIRNATIASLRRDYVLSERIGSALLAAVLSLLLLFAIILVVPPRFVPGSHAVWSSIIMWLFGGFLIIGGIIFSIMFLVELVRYRNILQDAGIHVARKWFQPWFILSLIVFWFFVVPCTTALAPVLPVAGQTTTVVFVVFQLVIALLVIPVFFASVIAAVAGYRYAKRIRVRYEAYIRAPGNEGQVSHPDRENHGGYPARDEEWSRVVP